MSDLTKFDNPNYTIAAKGHCVAIRTNQLGKVMHLTVNETLKLIAELESALDELAEVKKNG
jgi:hypothetical protein